MATTQNGLRDPRGLLSFSIPSRQLPQQIEKLKKPSIPHLVGNVRHAGSIVRQFEPKLASICLSSWCSYECTILFHTPPCLLHVLNFRGRPIARKFYSVEFFTRTFYNAEISRYTVFPFSFCATGRLGFILWLAQVQSFPWQTDLHYPTATYHFISHNKDLLLLIWRPASPQRGEGTAEQGDFPRAGEPWAEAAVGQVRGSGPQPHPTRKTGVLDSCPTCGRSTCS